MADCTLVEGAALLHVETRLDFNTVNVDKTAKDNKYPWLDKDDKRWNIIDREIIDRN